MALIGNIRDKMGTWVVIFVFVAIASFILTDMFSGNSSIMNWGRNTVGEIAGEEITIDEYQAVIREREASFFMSNGYEPGERDMPGIRQQAWDLLIARHAIVPQYEKVGVVVTDKEVVDMISGKNIFDGIRQSFINQETGEFDRAMLGNYINQLKTMPQGSEPRIRWELFQRDLKPSRERIKYENLLLKTNYVTSAEAEREYHLQTDVAEVKYLYVPYYAVSDSVAAVTDEALRNYYDEHKERFKTEQVRHIKYVNFAVIPSAEDSADVKEDLARAVTEFKNTQEDSLYAANNTDGENPFVKYPVGNLPAFINPDDLVAGNVIGPVLDGETYRVIKVSSIFNDTVYSARAKHILIRWTGTDENAKNEAKQKARDILRDIKAGADFSAKAREFGTDGTAARGGDLGWFSSGQMVKPFETAVFSATKPGVLNDVVETDFGYHIIEVTNVKNNKAVELAIIERQIVPSDNTLNEYYRQAELFASGLSGEEDFEARAKEQGLSVMEAKNIGPGETRIGSLGEARQVVQWLYRTASEGEVSEVFDLQDQYVVAIMTGEVEDGYKPLEMVKADITPAVRNEIKGKIIVDKLSGLNGSLEEMAQAFGSDANVYSSSDLKMSSNAMPTVGYDPKAVGLAFSLESGKRSAPTPGANGVVIIEAQNITVAPALNDYTVYKDQLAQRSYANSLNIAEAIKQHADIEDMRYKFY